MSVDFRAWLSILLSVARVVMAYLSAAPGGVGSRSHAWVILVTCHSIPAHLRVWLATVCVFVSFRLTHSLPIPGQSSQCHQAPVGFCCMFASLPSSDKHILPSIKQHVSHLISDILPEATISLQHLDVGPAHVSPKLLAVLRFWQVRCHACLMQQIQ